MFAWIADRTVADEYFADSEKVEALYDAPRRPPAEAEGPERGELRREMHRQMPGNGYCARPVETDCHFELICESCTFFVTTIEFRPTLERRRDDVAAKGQVAREETSTASWPDSTNGPDDSHPTAGRQKPVFR
ncbi:hypothetical protein [Streptomyces sp. NPDC086989]|uniref:hypothetical protein n=1 Tax=Streptomyces sp. NPDC086989 TaxID=3365764 RepID=UPI003827551B